MRVPLVFCALLAAAASAGCGDDAAPRPQQVQPLDVPTPAEREADEKLRDAEAFVDERAPKHAEPLLRRVLELRPDDRRAAELLAKCLYERGKADEAIPLLRRALEGPGRNAAARGLLVQALMQRGEYEPAVQTARAWTETDAQSSDAWFALGQALYRVDQFDEAIQAFKRAENLKGSRADVRSEHGLALAAAGRLQQAETKQRDAIDRQPEYADAWFRLGEVIFRRDPARVREAVEAMDRAVRIEPSMIVGHLYLFRTCRAAPAADAEALRARGEMAWRTVLRLHTHAQLGPFLAHSGAAEKDEKTSELALRERIVLTPDDPEPRLALARYLLGERRHEEAADTFRQAIAAGETSAPTRLALAAALAYLAEPPPARGGPVAAETDASRVERLLHEAETECLAVLGGAPRDAAANRLYAWVLLLEGRDAESGAAAGAAIEASPDDALAKKVRALARMHGGGDVATVDAGLQEIAALGWL